MEKFQLKNDSFRKSRGGYARFLNIYCEHCSEFLLLYQKDGSGPLKRLYLDRIFAPKELVGLQDTKKVENLVCKKCQKLIGIPGIYEKENRKVYLLLSYTFTKKLAKGS